MFTSLSPFTSFRISNDRLVLTLTGVSDPHVVLMADQFQQLSVLAILTLRVVGEELASHEWRGTDGLEEFTQFATPNFTVLFLLLLFLFQVVKQEFDSRLFLLVLFFA